MSDTEVVVHRFHAKTFGINNMNLETQSEKNHLIVHEVIHR